MHFYHQMAATVNDAMLYRSSTRAIMASVNIISRYQKYCYMYEGMAAGDILGIGGTFCSYSINERLVKISYVIYERRMKFSFWLTRIEMLSKNFKV